MTKLGLDAPEHAAGTLPLPKIRRITRLTTRARHALTTCDRQGRLADRSTVIAMEWTSQQRVTITVAGDRLVISADAAGQQVLTVQGFIRLPAAIRHTLDIRAGDRLLVAAYPDEKHILICSAAILDELLKPCNGGVR